MLSTADFHALPKRRCSEKIIVQGLHKHVWPITVPKEVADGLGDLLKDNGRRAGTYFLCFSRASFAAPFRCSARARSVRFCL